MIPLLALLLGCPPVDEDCSDVDADGVCDSDDACTGDDASGDTDMDGVCDDIDPCPGPDPANTDGSCTVTLAALSDERAWASIFSTREVGVCPPAGVTSRSDHTDEVSALQTADSSEGPYVEIGALSFDTSTIPADASEVMADLTIVSVENRSELLTVQLWGGTQPLFQSVGPTGMTAYLAGDTLVGTNAMSDILDAGAAEFSVPAFQVNKGGNTTFILRFDDPCPVSDGLWIWASPASETPPTLVVSYQP